MATRKKLECPKCGSPTIVPVIHGMPIGDDFERERRGEVILAGCIIYGGEPRYPYGCLECDWYGRKDKNGKLHEVKLHSEPSEDE